MSNHFNAFLVEKTNDSPDDTVVTSAWRPMTLDQLDPGDVLIEIQCSALNYKDSLSSTGQPGVALKLPLIPGIDAAGRVLESSCDSFKPGDDVFVAHANFGTSHHGGFAQRVRVPRTFVYHLPRNMSARQTVAWGTAGFTAAQSVERLIDNGVKPEDGRVVVGGATGGVGIFAVMLLAKLGYDVVASTGKLDRSDWLKDLGAAEIIDRAALIDDSKAPLLKGEFAGAIDTVGGNTLATILRKTKNGGCVTACGMVGGHRLATTVYPFILRGITLCGIDSANIDRSTREELWQRIATEWRLDKLNDVIEGISPSELETALEQISQGKIAGRVVVDFEN